METPVTFPCADGTTLEGRLQPGTRDAGVVIAHPHPLYGGDLHNPVVGALAGAYRRHGFTTLRFNFRGVGASGGRYAEGVGEQADVAAAVALLTAEGLGAIDLAGYSFGAWVNALYAGSTDVRHRQVMVSPPVAFIDFTGVPTPADLHLVVTGALDDIAPPAAVARRLESWGSAATFAILPGADHFFGGCTAALEALLAAHL